MNEVLGNVEQKDQGLNYFNTLDIETGEITTAVLDKKAILEVLAGKRPEIFSYRDLEALGEIEKEAFSEELAEEPEDLRAEFKEGGGGGYLFFAFRERGELVGYLFAKPAPKAKENFDELGLPADYFDAGSDNLYLESIAGKVGVWGRKIYHQVETQAKDLGYREISCHAVNLRLSRILQKEGFELKKEIPDWLGHRAEYLEKRL